MSNSNQNQRLINLTFKEEFVFAIAKNFFFVLNYAGFFFSQFLFHFEVMLLSTLYKRIAS